MHKKRKKIYVLDTSVILYSHDSIMNFEENDIGIPITVLEELDHMKKGNETLNFEAREFIRMIDELSKEKMLSNWISRDLRHVVLASNKCWLACIAINFSTTNHTFINA